MKRLALLFFPFFLTGNPDWLTDYHEARVQAIEKKELILLNFSGSDWCSPCIQLKSRLFESAEFKDFSTSSLVLLNADFPRLKKNKPAREKILQNEMLAEKYDPQGKFPYTILLDPNGKVLMSWDGVPDITPAAFVEQIKEVTNAHH